MNQDDQKILWNVLMCIFGAALVAAVIGIVASVVRELG